MSVKILYVCENCHVEASESCGRPDRREIAVMPDGTWLCEECADQPTEQRRHGVRPKGENEDEWLRFSDFPIPPEYVPTTQST